MTHTPKEKAQNNTGSTEQETQQNTYQSSTKRIAKNTLMLYFRQILIMLVSLYTVRVVLEALGAQDYGIYNVIAGVVVLFSFVNNAMASSTQRFLNYALGEGDEEKVQDVYSASLAVHALIALGFALAAETVGLWFVHTRLNIPEARKAAAELVYQCTVATTVFNIIRVPYHAVIIAYERMSFFAGLSIVEAALKLAVVFVLLPAKADKLELYGFLLAVVALVILGCYKAYCNRTFKPAHYRRVRDRRLVKEILSFSGWSLFGGAANVANSQGTNIVLNLYTDVTVNAAMGIANQVNAAVYSFVGNFQTAFNPQIVKSYASGEKSDFFRLIYLTAKTSFFLLLFIVLPLYLNADTVLRVWLTEMPAHSVSFVRLILIWSLIESLNGSLVMSVQAQGQIRTYQLIVSVFIMLNLPGTWIAFMLGANPEWLLYIRIFLLLVTGLWRVFYLRKKIGLSARKFFGNVLFRCVTAGGISFAVSWYVWRLLIDNVLVQFFVSCAVSLSVSVICMLCLGFSRSERQAVFATVKQRLKWE